MARSAEGEGGDPVGADGFGDPFLLLAVHGGGREPEFGWEGRESGEAGGLGEIVHGTMAFLSMGKEVLSGIIRTDGRGSKSGDGAGEGPGVAEKEFAEWAGQGVVHDVQRMKYTTRIIRSGFHISTFRKTVQERG